MDKGFIEFAERELKIYNDRAANEKDNIKLTAVKIVKDDFMPIIEKMNNGHYGEKEVGIATYILNQIAHKKLLTPVDFNNKDEWLETKEGLIVNKRDNRIIKGDPRYDGKPYYIPYPGAEVYLLEDHPGIYMNLAGEK